MDLMVVTMVADWRDGDKRGGRWLGCWWLRAWPRQGKGMCYDVCPCQLVDTAQGLGVDVSDMYIEEN